MPAGHLALRSAPYQRLFDNAALRVLAPTRSALDPENSPLTLNYEQSAAPKLAPSRSVVDAVRCTIEVQNGKVERNASLTDAV
jgi:hypothetical protein